MSSSARLQYLRWRWGRLVWLCGAVVLMSTAGRTALAWFDDDEIERACVALYGSSDGSVNAQPPERSGDDAQDAADAGAGATAERPRVCTAYLQGFLAGVAAQERALLEDAPAAGEETFSERAARTRGGGRTAMVLRGRGEGTQFCIDESVSAGELVARIEEYFDALADAPEGRYEALHAALVAAFPCDSQ